MTTIGLEALVLEIVGAGPTDLPRLAHALGSIRTVIWALRNLPCGPYFDQPAFTWSRIASCTSLVALVCASSSGDADRVRERAVRLLAAVAAVDALDQARLQQRAHVEVEVAGVDPSRCASSRFVSCSSFSPSSSRTRSAAGARAPSAAPASGSSGPERAPVFGARHRPSYRNRRTLSSSSVLKRLLDRGSRASGRSWIESGWPRRSPDRAARRRRARPPRPCRARDEPDEERRRLEHRDRHRHAVDERLELRLGRDRAPLALLEGRRVREERRGVPVRAEPSRTRSSETSRERRRRTRARRLLRAELALDPVHRAAAPRRVEQRALREPVVRALVVGRHAALVAPPELRVAPVAPQLGRELVRRARGSSRR